MENSGRDENTNHLTCLLRNLYAGQEATVRTGHGTTDWFQTGKGVCKGCILSPCLFNFYAKYIMRNAGLEETQAGIKIAGRNINKLNIQKTKIMASGPITSWGIDGEIMETVRDFILGGCRWRRKWQPTPVFLPGESQGRGSLVGCHLWGRTESDTTEVTQQQEQQTAY